MELPVKVAIVSGAVLLFAVLFGWVGFPALFKYKIKSVSFHTLFILSVCVIEIQLSTK